MPAQSNISYADFLSGIKSPMDTAMQGIQTLSGFKALENQELEANLAMLKMQQEQEKIETAKAQAEAMRTDLTALATNKEAKAADYITVMTKYPAVAKQLKGPYEALEEKEKTVIREQALDVFSAINAGQIDVAEKLLTTKMEAAKNSGNKAGEDSANAMLKILKASPESAKTSAGLFLASTLGEKEFSDYLQKLKDIELKKESAGYEGNMGAYVADRAAEYKLKTGKEMPRGERAKVAMQYKRAQAEEVKAVQGAKAAVDIATSERIAYNKQLGSKLAEIETAASLLEAKGEITPREKITKAKVRMEGNLSTLAKYYTHLDSQSGIVNIKKGSMSNIWARTKSSSAAQAFQNSMGTNEQKVRNMIKKIKPIILQDIRQSTDMSARGLDSNKELDFYMQAATDEKTDLQSNLAGIIVLSDSYGDGKVADMLRPMIEDEKTIEKIQSKGKAILNRQTKPKTAPASVHKKPVEAKQPSYMRFSSGAK